MGKKNVQIPYELFMDLVRLHVLEIDDAETWKRIEKGLNTKIDALLMHELYEKYKTAPSKDEREKARQEYLDRRGVHQDFRW